ncbi:WXG100 family type VII secretion target [Mycolicibacterium sp. BK556]|uniref:WXG100 family type VII secretion target n=1 Tax=unclassified Mycolicibacterium TaxID=2636767 RepID=UPI00161F3A9D|nr:MULTISPECIES: WXG100 family type VII secretion target [unclassified Mycolicibacterium]MBB3606376.1 WXG100 family type VII secretion target [Mycolicibacterium sp. BK556]MBB3636378.1 WXG100 family type VII secretion target [Mycolicibacterium sp. BK607]
MSLRVNIEHLAASGIAVTSHGEDVGTTHDAAAGRIDAAQAGWQGVSAAAMVLLSEQWVGTTSALVTRLSDHAQELRTGGQGFAAMEQRHSQELQEPAQAANAIATQTDL